MRVLLLNPPIKNIISLEMPFFVRENEGIFPPLGLMYIASYLKKSLGCRIAILDTVAERMGYEAIEQDIRRFSPEIVGITAHTHNLIDVIKVANIIKGIDSNIHVCLGGPHVNAFPQEAINIHSVDSVIPGSGEAIFTELVKCLEEKVNLRQVKGLIFKENGKQVNTGLRGDIEDLDSFPFPERTLLDHTKYYSILGRRTIMTTMASSRGCPYHCTFCSTPRGFYRTRSPGNVVSEMEECVRMGIGEVHFIDDTFNVDPRRVIEICDELERRRLKIKWSFRGRIDTITKSLLEKIKDAGCYRIHFGVETSSDEGLKRLKKDITIEQIRQVFKWARDVGVNTVAYFLIGCPHEKSRQDIIKTINFSKEINPDFALFNILTLYPSTELYEESLTKGMLKKDFWREFALEPRRDFQPPFWHEWLSKKELVYLLNLAYRKFYIRPRFIQRALCASQDLNILARRLKTGFEIFKLPLKR